METKLSLIPNPTNNVVVIKSEGTSTSDGNFILKIVDLSGQKVKELVVNEGSEISVIDLIPGLYLYSIVTTEGNSFHGKLLKY
ncbi:MAG: T9SS type A sorting domain-containing protein [Sphingobacteriales bacterium]|nr:MAG: T9SS type A sorting domain-containing protein [Sphingobacteriales bacterium]